MPREGTDCPTRCRERPCDRRTRNRTSTRRAARRARPRSPSRRRSPRRRPGDRPRHRPRSSTPRCGESRSAGAKPGGAANRTSQSARVSAVTESSANAPASARPSWPPAPGDQDATAVSRGERIGVSGAPQVLHARVVPGDPVLVGIGRIVLLGDVIDEQKVGQRLESVCMAPRDVQRDRVLVTDVLGERRPRRSVENDHARRPLKAREQVVLATLVVVEASDHAPAGERDVRLHRRARQQALAPKLAEPAPPVLIPTQRDPLDPLDTHLLTPVSSIRRPISARCCQCLPASSHQP